MFSWQMDSIEFAGLSNTICGILEKQNYHENTK
jgi:hypothetical protein